MCEVLFPNAILYSNAIQSTWQPLLVPFKVTFCLCVCVCLYAFQTLARLLICECASTIWPWGFICLRPMASVCTLHPLSYVLSLLWFQYLSLSSLSHVYARLFSLVSHCLFVCGFRFCVIFSFLFARYSYFGHLELSSFPKRDRTKEECNEHNLVLLSQLISLMLLA